MRVYIDQYEASPLDHSLGSTSLPYFLLCYIDPCLYGFQARVQLDVCVEDEFFYCNSLC